MSNYLNESGFSLALYRLFGWGQKGQPLVEAVPSQRGKNLSLLGAFDLEGMVATTCKIGAMKRVDIERFLRVDLLPCLEPGAVLVFDNARIHHGGAIERLVHRAGCSLLYLPPYSPDFNPIELAWGWIKNAVRLACPRSDGERVEAIEAALRTLPERHAPAWFRKCGCIQPI